MALFSRIKGPDGWVTNEVLSSNDLDAEFDNIIEHMTPTYIEGISTSVAEMQSTLSPGGLGTENLSATMSEELKKLRYVIARLTGGEWYEAPAVTLGSLFDANDIADNAVETKHIKDLNVTDAKIADNTITSDKMAFWPRTQTQVFNTTGTWLCPVYVTSILVFGIGGGGGGGAGGGTDSYGGEGGFSGYGNYLAVTVSPGVSYTVTVGAGGVGGASGAGGAPGFDGSPGTASNFGGIVSFSGGRYGRTYANVAPNFPIPPGNGESSFLGNGGVAPHAIGNVSGASAGVNTGAGGSGGFGTGAGGNGGSGRVTVIWVRNP